MPHQVFVSYATEDKPTADRVCVSLEASGIQCWIAPRDIEAGTSYPASIVNAVQTSRAMVLVFSSHANASPHVTSEVRCAFDNGVALLPFRIEECDLSADLQYFLATVQWLDAWDGPVEGHLDRLKAAVADALSGSPAPPVPRRSRQRDRIWIGASLAVILVGALGAYYIFGLRQNAKPDAPASTFGFEPAPRGSEASVPTAKKPTVSRRDGLRYVWIAPGRFLMGCSAGDSECDDDEKPAHWVTIKNGFWIGQSEVTVAAYRTYAMKSGVRPPDGQDNQPVTNIDRRRAKAFCEANGGRLPTESEWEYAARAGRQEARYDALSRIAWSASNSGEMLHEVMTKQPNAFGLYDMLGNASEWVLDRYYDKYDEEDPGSAPEEPTAPNASGVLRGGSAFHEAQAARASNRFGAPADLADAFSGFRCVSANP
jgi:formylglycine-generating enzyme required for sulfatase activity